ncbi:MAG: hypothetical protein PUK42_07465, partial [Prevotellaceae bacterium]|nr:hypothetical protein [Prevotellaceae bacterium]
GYYKQCLKPNMAHYERTDGNQFLYTQINQKEIDALDIYAYASYWLLPEKFQIAATEGCLDASISVTIIRIVTPHGFMRVA